MDTSLDQFYKKAYKKSIEIPELFLSKIAFSVLKGLEFMKSLNLMHRDIKPSNILLNYDGDIKLCDFGISGITADSFFKTVIGTPPYMAPERRDVPVDGYTIKADVWSLGISLVRL
jgi:serine/threonine protein kinase